MSTVVAMAAHPAVQMIRLFFDLQAILQPDSSNKVSSGTVRITPLPNQISVRKKPDSPNSAEPQKFPRGTY